MIPRQSNVEKIDKANDCFYFGLGWETKADLDTHVYGLSANGSEIYHVYFGNKKSLDGAVSLDQDDRSGDGKAGMTTKLLKLRLTRLMNVSNI